MESMQYILTATIALFLILIYCFINNNRIAAIISKIVSRDTTRHRSKQYMERFSENKSSKMSGNLIVQVLPWLCVLGLVFILGNQYIVFASVLTASMVPTFEPGDMVLMQTFDKKVNQGDIVMFRNKNFKEPILHRVVGMNKDGDIVTRGDANPTNDDPFPPKAVGGKAITIGGNPILLKGLGYYIRPENIGEQRVLTKEPMSFVIADAFRRVQSVQPMIIFFGTIFYFFILIETRMDSNKRSGKRNRESTYKEK